MKFFSLLLLMFIGTTSQAQLTNGSTAPNFTLTDIDGNTQDLYSYLNQGKVVYIDFFACHCPTCWNYHNAGILEDLYQQYGPDGTDQIMVLMIEHDPNNGHNEFNGISGWTAGDWVTGTSFPQINPEGADRTIFDDYIVNYYPLIYKICPDKTVEIVSTSNTVAELYQKADDCPGELSVLDLDHSYNVYLNESKALIIEGFDQVNNIQLINQNGQVEKSAANTTLDLQTVKPGIYFVSITHSEGTTRHRIAIP